MPEFTGRSKAVLLLQIPRYLCFYVSLCYVGFGFVALRPKSTAMVIAGRSVHLTTLFSWAGLNKRLTSNLCTYFRL